MQHSTPAPSAQRRDWLVALIVTALLIAAIGWWHSRGIGDGGLSHYDEFYTFDRALGFSRFDDWGAVFALGEPTLKKPPMQYWMSAGLMEMGVSDILALRLPSLFFGLCTLFATAALAALMVPRQPWIMPVAVALLSSSAEFWGHATAAMLDSGAAFFSTLGILAILAALKDRRYWVAFPIATFLAGLQKGPTPMAFLLFAVLGLAFTARLQKDRVRDVLYDRRFIAAMVIGLFAGFAWQIFQEIRFSGQTLEGSVESEMLKRFEPSLWALAAAGLAAFDELILSGEPLVRILGLVGLVVLPALTRTPRMYAATGIAVFFVIFMLAASGSVYARYTLTILPLLSVGAAALPFLLLRHTLFGAGVAVAVIALAGGPFQPFGVLAQSRPDRFDVPLEDILAPLAASFREGEVLVLCNEGRRIPPGAVSIYAPNTLDGFPLQLNGGPGMEDTLERRRYDGGPVRGICEPGPFEEIEPYLVGPETTPLPGGLLMWSASGFRFDPT